MKKLLIIVLSLLYVEIVFAQIATFPYSQNFESGLSIPTGWTNDPGNSGENWIYVTGAIGYGATADHTNGLGNYAAVDDSSPNSSETGLITPEFDFSGLTGVSLSFWYWIGDDTYLSELIVDTYDNGWALGAGGILDTSTTGWVKHEVEINKSVTKIRFRVFESASDKSDVCIDDVVLEDRDPEFNVSPDIFSFDDTFVGTSSVAQTFTVTNTGWGDLIINPAVTIVGTNANQFILNDGTSYPVILGEGQNYIFEVLFHPTSAGSKLAFIQITDNLSKTIHDVQIMGDGVDATIDNFPYSQNFESGLSLPTNWTNDANDSGEDWIFVTGAIGNGATADHSDGFGNYAGVDDSAPDNTPTNLITPPFDFSSLSSVSLSFWYWIGDANPNSGLAIDTSDGFTWTQNVGSVFIGTTGWVQYEIEIPKTVVQIRFRAVESWGTQSDICLDDIIIQERVPVFSVSPSIYDFGEIHNLQSSAEKEFIVANNGFGALVINPAVYIVGTNSNEFSLNDVNSYPVTLQYNQTYNFGVTFNPTTVGNKIAFLQITDNTSRIIHDVQIAGTSVAIGQPLSQNETILLDDQTENDFTNVDMSLQFTTNHALTSMTITQYFEKPNIVGVLPNSLSDVGDVYWNVDSGNGNVGNYNITFDLSEVSGIQNFNSLHFLKRVNNSSVWQDVVTDLGATLVFNEPLITIQGLTAFSDFVPSGDFDAPLPVELSSFAGYFNNGAAFLNWATESETNNSHWNVYRNETENFDNSEKINDTEIDGAGNSNTTVNYEFQDLTNIEYNKTYYYWIESVDFSGTTTLYNPISIVIPQQDDNSDVPNIVQYGLQQNYPNPFNPSTKISFILKESATASLEIYNLKGEKIITLINDEYIENDIATSVIWNGLDKNSKNVSSGIYFYKLMAGKQTEIKQMLLLK